MRQKNKKTSKHSESFDHLELVQKLEKSFNLTINQLSLHPNFQERVAAANRTTNSFLNTFHDLEKTSAYKKAIAASITIADALQAHQRLFKVHLPAVEAIDKVRASLDVLQNPEYIETLNQIASITDTVRGQMQTLAARYQDIQKTLLPGDRFAWIIKDQRAASIVNRLGIVPHGGLWAYVLDLDADDSSDYEAMAEELAHKLWPELRKELTLSLEECLEDPRLAVMYKQLHSSHDHKNFEAVNSLSTSIIERSVLLARSKIGGPRSTFEWIQKKLGESSIKNFGSGGYRVWIVVHDHLFKSCWSDEEAAENFYPSRHAAAHGIGANTVSVIDSLNSILLAHFMVTSVNNVVTLCLTDHDLKTN